MSTIPTLISAMAGPSGEAPVRDRQLAKQVRLKVCIAISSQMHLSLEVYRCLGALGVTPIKPNAHSHANEAGNAA